jgi:hypothetical protein
MAAKTPNNQGSITWRASGQRYDLQYRARDNCDDNRHAERSRASLLPALRLGRLHRQDSSTLNVRHIAAGQRGCIVISQRRLYCRVCHTFFEKPDWLHP